jgi:hypothetical protein
MGTRFFCYVEMMEKASKKATKTLPNPKKMKMGKKGTGDIVKKSHVYL